jgi:hypothetical protein
MYADARYSAAQLFGICPDSQVPAHSAGVDPDPATVTLAGLASTADVAAVFASRSQFADAADPLALIQSASRIRACGLSLNLICQQLPDQQLLRQLTDGTQLTCLFLDPAGEAITAREQEEEYPPGFLADLTRLNIQVMTRLRDRLPSDARERLDSPTLLLRRSNALGGLYPVFEQVYDAIAERSKPA